MDDAKTFCLYLDRMFRLRLPEPIKAKITEAFLNVKSTDDLKNLCINFKTLLNRMYGYHPYFDLY